MSVISMKELLEVGAHFGHQAKRWNPKMKPYIYAERSGLHILDLQQTLTSTEKAYEFVRNISSEGGKILFVGTKKQAQDAVKEEAQRCGGFYVNQRWLGGLLTNLETIKKRVKKLKELEELDANGTLDQAYTKKEAALLRKEMSKLEKNVGGIKEMHKLPAALFVVDIKKEFLALEEAAKLGIPVIALIDTNVDPDLVTYRIPANDDAIRSIKLFTKVIAEAVIEANGGKEETVSEEVVENLEENFEALKEEFRIIGGLIMAVTPQLIKELRERSGAGMLDCKKALEANEGNIDKAIDWLREKGIAKAAKKSGRVAAEGLVFGTENGKVGALVEFNSETDFVAKNEDFKSFGELLVKLVVENEVNTVEDLKALKVDGKTVEELLTELIAKIGENLNIRRVVFTKTSGFVATYIHLGGKIGVLIELEGENTPENHEKARAAAMHMAAMDPKYLTREEVTASDLEKEKEIERNNLLQEGKPENIIEKILEGKMRKFYEENCFLEQKFVRDDKVTVKQFLAPLTLKSCVRYKVGEGIEKVETDFAAEVAAQIAASK